MSVRKLKNGKYEVRIQVNGKRIRAGNYPTEKAALEAESAAQKRLKSLDKLSIDNCGPYEPKFEHTDTSVIHKWIQRYRKHKAEKKKDKETKAKLEAM